MLLAETTNGSHTGPEPVSGRRDPALIFAFALLVRLGISFVSPGGFSGNYGYDGPVYYASSDALIHGRVPYADFVLLHPPGLMLFLTPFAFLGRLTSDHAGFITASVAFSVLGALNAGLVVRISRVLGLSRWAALIGGAFYAVWSGVTQTEVTTRLEPLGTFLLLCGLLVLSRRPAPSTRALVLAGALIALASSVKIWWIVPLLVVLAWQLISPLTRRRFWPMLAGAVGALLVVIGPFFALAPAPMWRMVITDQLGRQNLGTPLTYRLRALTSLDGVTKFGAAGSALLGVVALLVIVVIARAAWRTPACRLFVVLAVIQVLVLLAGPSYFSYYAAYPSAAFALVLAAGANGHSSPGRKSLARLAAAAVVAAAAASNALGVATGHTVVSHYFPGAQLASAVKGVRCVVADAPMALIELNSLSRDLARGCPNWVDVTGRTYDADAGHGTTYTPRPRNRKWQADLRPYLLSGNAVILIRPATGLSAATRRAVTSHPVLARSHGYTVYRIRR